MYFTYRYVSSVLPVFTELMDKIKHGGSMFYSWNIGLGADFISLYAYYLASPLNWLLLLCPQNHVIEFMTLLVILKISLAGLFFGYYLKEHFEKIMLQSAFLQQPMRCADSQQPMHGISCG